MIRKSIFIGLAAAVFFSIFFMLGVFDFLNNQVYNYFLGFRQERDRTDKVVFLDVDDPAIAYNGVFPWPRSINADGLLRLKEYGALAAIFDIEFIDKGPQGVDTIYLNQGLQTDFRQIFGNINSAAADVFSALKAGRIDRNDIDEYARDFSALVRGEEDDLYARAQRIARDNDQYLVQSSALFGKSWVSLNLRTYPLEGEQSQRRPLAEELFSYPVAAAANANRGNFVDVLPPIPGFTLSAKGAGYTNVEIDPDGIRRRIFLTQNINDHWYLQLVFAPLMDYLGSPRIELEKNKMVIRDANMPGGIIKDLVIPLDSHGRAMLDWPKSSYQDSYDHVSFYEFSLLEDYEAEIEKYARAFLDIDINFFAQFDTSLIRVPMVTRDLAGTFDNIRITRAAALEYTSDEYFDAYLEYCRQSRSLVRELLDFNLSAKVDAMVPDLAELYPESAYAIYDEAEYIAILSEALDLYLQSYEDQRDYIENKVKGKFCILGRVDTGTTDIGANPFDPEYINVGTHGVIIDMILSESFITPIASHWLVLFTLVFVFLFFLISGNFSPVPRTAAGFLIIALLIAGSLLLFRYTGIFASPVLAGFSMIGAVIVREIISYAGSEREKQFIRKAFSTYVSDDVVKEIIADPSRLQLGGTKRHMSAIFTDVQGFSTISEQLDPENLVSLLNRYLTFMSDAILEEMGTIDKYEGDAIVAFFGAPVEMADHARRACISAIAMKRIEDALNKKIAEENLSPSPLLTRIGINTGSMVAGNMGTGNKMNYTIMGNAVNLAARLEGVNKQYKTWILASEDTIKETEDRFLARRLDRIRVIGINEPVLIYELINSMENASGEEIKLVQIFHEALDYYNARNWKMAAQGFNESLSMDISGPSAVFLKRCRHFQNNPPPENWDGVNNLTEK